VSGRHTNGDVYALLSNHVAEILKSRSAPIWPGIISCQAVAILRAAARRKHRSEFQQKRETDMSQNCRKCSIEASDTKEWCPSCGARLGIRERSVTGKRVVWGFIVFNMILGGVFIHTMSVTASSTPDHLTAMLGATGVIAFWGAGALLLGVLMLITQPEP